MYSELSVLLVTLPETLPSGLQPDLRSYELLLRACVSLRRLDLASQLIQGPLSMAVLVGLAGIYLIRISIIIEHVSDFVMFCEWWFYATNIKFLNLYCAI